MNKLLIKNGSLLSVDDGYEYQKSDILVVDGVIVAIDSKIEELESMKVIDAEGLIISPGFIDIHAHCFEGYGELGVNPDTIGIKKGVTTLIDAGSAGPLTFNDFKNNSVLKSRTRVYSLLNISKNGLMERSELNSMDKIDQQLVIETVNKNRDIIIGLKARASKSVVGEMGILPIQIASDLSKDLSIPLMIHTGNYPPKIEEVLELMKPNDILTHAFHGKGGGILDKDGNIIVEALDARARGVKFDVGHGTASFSFETFKKALEKGFGPDFVSTDIHSENFEGIVESQHLTMTKLMNSGMRLEELVAMVTSRAAVHFGLHEIGRLEIGKRADLSIYRILEESREVLDSEKTLKVVDKQLVPVYTIISKAASIDMEKHYER